MVKTKNIIKSIIFPIKCPNPYSVNLSKSLINIWMILINNISEIIAEM